MSEHSSAYIKRLQNGWFVRLGWAYEYYFPDLKTALNHAGTALADPGDPSSSWLPIEATRDQGVDKLEFEQPREVAMADEHLADQIIEALEKLEGVDPDDDATIFIARKLVKGIRGTVPAAVESRIVQVVREKLRVKRLLEAKSGDERKRKKGG